MQIIKKLWLLFLLGLTTNIPALAQNSKDTMSLKNAVNKFIQAVDSGKIEDVIAFYDDDFKSIRVVDEGPLIKMDRQQMIYFWKMITSKNPSGGAGPNRQQIIAQNTTIHYTEVTGDTGYTLMTRIKNFGSGPETVFYNLVWHFTGNHWQLVREIVHQHTLPKAF